MKDPYRTSAKEPEHVHYEKSPTCRGRQRFTGSVGEIRCACGYVTYVPKIEPLLPTFYLPSLSVFR